MPCLLFHKDGVVGSVDIKILPAKKDRKLTRETKVSVLPCVKLAGLIINLQVTGQMYKLHQHATCVMQNVSAQLTFQLL